MIATFVARVGVHALHRGSGQVLAAAARVGRADLAPSRYGRSPGWSPCSPSAFRQCRWPSAAPMRRRLSSARLQAERGMHRCRGAGNRVCRRRRAAGRRCFPMSANLLRRRREPVGMLVDSRATAPCACAALGPVDGYEKHLLAVGDSHNNTLLEAYESIANSMNWRIDVAGRVGCYWTEAEHGVQHGRPDRRVRAMARRGDCARRGIRRPRRRDRDECPEDARW